MRRYSHIGGELGIIVVVGLVWEDAQLYGEVVTLICKVVVYYVGVCGMGGFMRLPCKFFFL